VFITRQSDVITCAFHDSSSGLQPYEMQASLFTPTEQQRDRRCRCLRTAEDLQAQATAMTMHLQCIVRRRVHIASRDCALLNLLASPKVYALEVDY
jgi:hypothetical protein